MIRSRIALATLISGTLDALFASGMTLAKGKDVGAVWRGVASGPFGDGAKDWGLGGSLLGLGVHFALMALMAAVLGMLLRQPRIAAVNWAVIGVIYGLATYLVMYGIVLPWRFGSPFPQTNGAAIASALFAHVVLVGLVMSWLFRRTPAPA